MTNTFIGRIPSGSRSVIRRLEDLLPEIEAGLARGYPHAMMHAELPALGINISFAYYERVLRLLRQERRNAERCLKGTSSPTPADTTKPEAPVTLPPISKMNDLTGAISDREDGSADKVAEARVGPQPFRWKGADLLNKDWSDF